MLLCVAGIITLVALLLYLFLRQPPSQIPSVSILEYFPNGLLNPIAKDPKCFQRTLHKVADRVGRVFFVWLGLNHALVTAIPADIAYAMSSDAFERTPTVVQPFAAIAEGGLFTMPRDAHRHMKRLLKSKLGSSTLANFEPQMLAAVTELCQTLTQAATDLQPNGKSRVVDISAILNMTTIHVITNVAFGAEMDKDQRESFAKLILLCMDEMLAEALGYPMRQLLTCFGVRKRLFDCKKQIHQVCNAFIEKRLSETKEAREARFPDILDVFVNLDRTASNPDADPVAALVVEFALGGAHTTSQALAWSIYETCCNNRVVTEIEKELEDVLHGKPLDQPISLDELQKLPYIHKVWKETLRLHPIGAGISRLARSEATLPGSGVRISKGGHVFCFLRYTQTDPQLWSEHQVFKPERWGSGTVRGEGERVPPGAFVPFGLGILTCPGKFLADYEGPLILAELHRRFRFSLPCAPDEVVSCTSFVETPRYASKKGCDFDMGIPMYVETKS